MGDYKKQHTITEAYLRGFTAKTTPNTLWRFDKADGQCEEKNVANATVKFHAYSFRELDGDWNHNVEHFLGDIENAAIPLLPKLATWTALSDEERHQLSFFIATIVRRPAALLEHFQNSFLEYRNQPARLLAFFETLVPELAQNFSQEEIQTAREAIERREFDVSLHQAKAGHFRAWLQHLPKYANIIANMRWQIWKAGGGHCFLTSDAPAFVRRNARDEDMGVVGIARDDLNAELTFPITKGSLLIVIATHNSGERVYKATKTRVRELNSLIIRMAHRHVFATEQTESNTSLVAQNRSFSAPLPELGSLAERLDDRYGLSKPN